MHIGIFRVKILKRFITTRRMEVTRQNFNETLPSIEKAIEECDFMSLDTEFTGLFADSTAREDYLDTLNERYDKVKRSGDSFIITQFGLSTAQFTSDGEWKLNTWNFYIFPRPYGSFDERFLCQASSIQFLSEHGFDFNKFIAHGIPYMNQASQRKSHKDLGRDIERASSTSDRSNSFRITSARDQLFAEEIETKIQNWLNDPDRDLELVIMNRNSFQRMLIHQIARHKFNGLYTESNEWQKITIAKVTKKQRQERIEQKVVGMKRKLDDAIGFSKVIELMSESRKPIIGHNALLDFVYLYRQFCNPLPETLAEFKTQLQDIFPTIYDTKHIARMTCIADEFDTSLGSLFEGLSLKLQQPPETLLDIGSDKYANASDGFAHEAGYDAYMTAVVFLALASRAAQDWTPVATTLALTRSLPLNLNSYANKLNLMQSDAVYLDLDDHEQQVDRSKVYEVTIAKDKKNFNCYEVFDAFGVRKYVRRRDSVFVFLDQPLSLDEKEKLTAAHDNISISEYNASSDLVEEKEDTSSNHCIIS